MYYISLFVSVLVFSAISAADQALPVEAFSQLPQNRAVSLSPDGEHIAFLHNVDDHTILVVKSLATNKLTGLVKTDNEKYKIIWLNWANNDKIVFSALFPYRRYGTATQERRLMVVDKRGEDGPRELVKAKNNLKGRDEHVAQLQDNVINWLPDDPKHILLSVDLDQAAYASVYRVDVEKKTRKRIKRADVPVRSWRTDQQGVVRIGNAYDTKTGVAHTRILDIEANKWHTMWERQALLDPPYVPLGFGLDPHTLYVRADHDGRGAIFTIDTRHLDQPPTLKISDPKYDIQGTLIYSTKTNDAIGVYHGAVKGNRIYWNSAYQALQGGIDKTFPDTNNQLISFSRDEQRYILYVGSDVVPGKYFFGDRSKATLKPALETYPALAAANLAPKKRIDIRMRDGLEIEAYLTLPLGRTVTQAIPAIIFPYGGPISRDYGGFDYWTQFFASRGIAVLQPNFRGSSGYGHDFKLQAVNNYGLGMQNDLADATRWMIDQGIADAKRVCIVGASYGGYAALTGAFSTPDLYRCAISFAGISDLKAHRDSRRKFINRKIANQQFGEDNQQLKQTSAYFNVDRINIPILLVHGELDRVVQPSQSRKLAKRLEKAGKEFEYIELENGSHYLMKQKNRTALLQAMDEFLAEHLLSATLAKQ